jgi:diaminohydroxyphosphoribosylaminopyrimidine deaminase/5-amino-6-(5-phosphoribosylamino)uracil reductase
MGAALALARRGLGAVWPNPAVGCLIVKDGRVRGRGWTQPGGRPHAETEALRRAGAAAAGATAYISLEPCAHYGETPPCADALVAAGIARAVIALGDPDPRVDGGGIKVLAAAGIEVVCGVAADEAAEINAGFLLRVAEGRPLVTLKLATSLDGRIATGSGESKWITGEDARRFAHGLRAGHDAVLVGAGTALLDDPELTCRLPGLEQRSPVRVVVDGSGRLPPTHRLVAGAHDVATWLMTLPPDTSQGRERRKAYEQAGVEVIDVTPDDHGHPAIAAVLAALAERGITRLLVEGGGRINAAFLKAGLVDRLVWFRASSVIGGDGVPAAAAFGLERLAEVPNFSLVSTRPVGDDMMESYLRVAED